MGGAARKTCMHYATAYTYTPIFARARHDMYTPIFAKIRRYNLPVAIVT